MSTLQDGVLGPTSWLKTKAYGEDVYIDGQLIDPQSVRTFLKPGQGAVVPLLSGAGLHQQLVGHPHAPESTTPLGIVLSILATTVPDLFLFDRILTQLFDLWVELPFEDRWVLRGDGRTVFTLSRPTAGLVVDTTASGAYAPSARISDFPVEDVGTDTALTVIESGSPAAGEILISATARTTTVTTADLSAEAPGVRALVVRHWPVRVYALKSKADEETLPQGVLQTLTLSELVGSVDYDLVVQP